MQRKAQERLKDINGAYEVLSQFLGSGGSEKREREKQAWSEPQPNRSGDDPPSPPQTKNNGKSANDFARSKIKLVCLLLFAVGVIAYGVHLSFQYREFTNQLTVVNGIHIGDARAEVKYRLGFPTSVLDPAEKGEFGWSQRNYTGRGAF